MKKLILITLILLSTSIVESEQRYVYIDKIGVVHPGEEDGQTELGDIVAITPFTNQYKPTKAELRRYLIVVVDLTEEEAADLIEPVTVIDDPGTEAEITRPILARKKKFDFSLLPIPAQEAVLTHAPFMQKITTKP